LGIDVADAIKDAQLTGTGISAWESPQELRVRVAAEGSADGSLSLSFAMEAIQPEAGSPEVYAGPLALPAYVSIPMPKDSCAEEASLTNARGEAVAFKARDQKVGFVVTSLGEYRFSGWDALTEGLPALTVRLGEALIMPEELDGLDPDSDAPQEGGRCQYRDMGFCIIARFRAIL